MKKSSRPAVSKVSGDRGKAEVAAPVGTGKPAAKSTGAAPLSKVRLMMNRLAADLCCCCAIFLNIILFSCV